MQSCSFALRILLSLLLRLDACAPLEFCLAPADRFDCPCIIFASDRRGTLRKTQIVLIALAFFTSNAALAQSGLQSSDLYKLRSVGDVQFSPDGSHIAYVVENNGQIGRPYSQLWIMNIA